MESSWLLWVCAALEMIDLLLSLEPLNETSPAVLAAAAAASAAPAGSASASADSGAPATPAGLSRVRSRLGLGAEARLPGSEFAAIIFEGWNKNGADPLFVTRLCCDAILCCLAVADDSEGAPVDLMPGLLQFLKKPAQQHGACCGRVAGQ